MNNVLTRRKDWKPVFCNASMTKRDIPVQSGLALTPRKVRELTEKGIAVSTAIANDNQFFATDAPNDYRLDPMEERGITREELWERSQVAKQRIMSARKKKAIVEQKDE